MIPITSIILCGGRATRLQGTISPDLPKFLVPLSDSCTMCDYLLAWLKNRGVRRVVLCLGHLHMAIVNHLRAHPDLEQEVDYSVDPFYGCGVDVALRHARPLIKTQDVLVLNGDTVFTSFDLGAMVTAYGALQGPLVAVNAAGVSAGAVLLPTALLTRLRPLEGAVPWPGAEFVDAGTPGGWISAREAV